MLAPRRPIVHPQLRSASDDWRFLAGTVEDVHAKLMTRFGSRYLVHFRPPALSVGTDDRGEIVVGKLLIDLERHRRPDHRSVATDAFADRLDQLGVAPVLDPAAGVMLGATALGTRAESGDSCCRCHRGGWLARNGCDDEGGDCKGQADKRDGSGAYVVDRRAANSGTERNT